ncbi:MAG: heavy metal translocating P-type ATPase metal-binding domain-containing protein [Rhodocyclaceae bacterium]|jgi:hypothetical protein|nr:heavy metal translocating P-type ATPase metal-binding domain-containing protein [Rhodocyclaceae bacterium]
MIPCDLCSLDCGNKPFELATPEKTLNFCCEGCRGIYEMLHDIKAAPAPTEQNTHTSPERSRT